MCIRDSFNSVTEEKARNRMIAGFDLDNTVPEWALAFRFDLSLIHISEPTRPY